MKDNSGVYSTFIEEQLCYNNGFDDGKEEMKHQINEILNTYMNGPYDDKYRDMLYNIRKEIEKL